ncbi:MAG: tyrosine-type recombinase/integrase [bacterium]|nr:tyrosine-type recombinase/integrase [bacterium]
MDSNGDLYRTKAAFLFREEVNALLDACADRIKPLVTLAVYTGMRFGDLTGLEWRDVDIT